MTSPTDEFELRSEVLGPLPVVNHFLDRLGVADLLARHVPQRRPAAPISTGSSYRRRHSEFGPAPRAGLCAR